MTEPISNQNNISLETVLHALYGCSNVQSEFTDAVYICPTCAYGSDDGRPCESLHPLLYDAYTLLKVQEPKPVHVTAIINNRKIGECPNCGKPINSGDYLRYCGDCGQAVKWE